MVRKADTQCGETGHDMNLWISFFMYRHDMQGHILTASNEDLRKAVIKATLSDGKIIYDVFTTDSTELPVNSKT